jgi:DNA invertase Pin-like site-specific DNA recombinase
MIRSNEPHQKVRPEHLKRDAYLYIRQSTIQQVFHNTESTQRQYGLRQRAVALGWPIERVIVIDSDQGQSAASAADREGFQKLVAEVGMGRVGIVLGLEVSRLARNCSDWHRLLEICALTGTLILDEDGLYDPANFNDRLVLGLKGTMSEAELHVLRARLQGGIRNKARRGELRMALPVGLTYDSQGKVILDPDRQVQQAIGTFFQVYQRQGTAFAVMRHFLKNGLSFPRRLRRGVNKGQLVWGPLDHSRALHVLRNPRYAGAFVFGRTQTVRQADGGKHQVRRPQEDWDTLIPDAHPGYISWPQYQDNQRILHACAQAYGQDRRHGPPGQGPTLLQGLVVCGVCGRRMTVRYHQYRHHRVTGDYICQHESTDHGQPVCQTIPGSGIDQAIGQLLLEMIQPASLELAFAVQAELQTRLDEVDKLRQQQVERARYEADLARSRFMQVDPNNRLVADALEADWNQKLRTLTEAQQQYEQQRQKDRAILDESTRQQVLALATDLPRLWRDPATRDQDRKRIVRLLIEDVTLTRADQIKAYIRFKGGATQTLALPLPPTAAQLRKTSPEVVAEVDRLLDTLTEGQIAAELNQRGYRSGTGGTFTLRMVWKIRQTYRLKSRYTRLREAGMLCLKELAGRLGVCTYTIKRWQRHGLLRAHAYNDKNQFLYEPTEALGPVNTHGVRLVDKAQFLQVVSNSHSEVHHEA